MSNLYWNPEQPPPVTSILKNSPESATALIREAHLSVTCSGAFSSSGCRLLFDMDDREKGLVVKVVKGRTRFIICIMFFLFS
jgi:hypothetical protein